MRLIFFFVFSCFTLFAQTPKVIVFDFGGVVAKVDRKPLLEFIAKTADKPYKKVKKEFAHEELYIALEKPHAFWESYTKKSLSLVWQDEFEKKKQTLVQEISGMRTLIEELKRHGIQVALLSNTREHRARIIEKLGAYDQFDPILLSCYLGEKKPNPRVYQILLDHLKWKPSECLFIDDRLRNVESAKKCGLDSILFEGVDRLKALLIERGLPINHKEDI